MGFVTDMGNVDGANGYEGRMMGVKLTKELRQAFAVPNAEKRPRAVDTAAHTSTATCVQITPAIRAKKQRVRCQSGWARMSNAGDKSGPRSLSVRSFIIVRGWFHTRHNRDVSAIACASA